MRRITVLIALFGVAMTTPPARADVQVAYLRKDCGTLPDCFTTSAALVNWIGNVRMPSELSPLLVDIGPGTFDRLSCGTTFTGQPSFSYVTFRGSGRERTVIKTSCVFCGAVEAGAGCHDLAYEDLSVDGNFWGAVWWAQAGNSTWTNVDILGGRIGWYEITFNCEPATNFATHYWFNSRITARSPDGFAGHGYEANCSETWFYGSQINVLADGAAAGDYADGFAALSVGGNVAQGLGREGEVYAFGTDVRVIGSAAPSGLNPTDGIAGVRVYETGELHFHGGEVEVVLSNAIAAEIAGVKVGPGGIAHMPAASFEVTGGQGLVDGKTKRISGTGARSPFQWPPGTEPPRANASPTSKFLASTVGSDLFVETDCSGTGNCNGGGTETHLMIYNDVKCSASNPWYNSTKAKCR